MADHEDEGFNDLETGVIKSKKTYFAILAHTNEEALAAQVQNIRHFNPDAGVIVYNGGTDPGFGTKLNILLYPGSHPIQYGNLTPYFWEIMKWLEEKQVEYDYLINLDHDVLFLKPGFEDYLDQLMINYDVMGWDMVTTFSPEDTDLTCCQDMWKAWDVWGPFFRTDYFIRFLNSTQVYRHGIVRRMLDNTDHRLVENMISRSNVFALEEMFFVTLAHSLGGRIREYRRDESWSSAARFGLDQISLEEARQARQHPYYYWIHPVKETWLIRLNRFLLGETDAEALMEALPPLREPAPSGEDAPAPISNPLPGKSKQTRSIPQKKRAAASNRRRLKAGKKDVRNKRNKIKKLRTRKPAPAISAKRVRK